MFIYCSIIFKQSCAARIYLHTENIEKSLSMCHSTQPYSLSPLTHEKTLTELEDTFVKAYVKIVTDKNVLICLLLIY